MTPPVIRPQGSQDVTLQLLPTRGEKMLIPSPQTVLQASQLLESGFSKGQPTTFNYPLSVSQLQGDFNLSAALEPLTDFVVVYIQNRIQAGGAIDHIGASTSTNAVFRWLINPYQVSISHTTLNSESFDRAGWQFGVWGEDMVRISMTGKTPGQYFTLGTTDEFAEFSESYRNLEQMQDVFENNGYWFEGEQVNNSNALQGGSGMAGAPNNFTRRTIKMHQDVVLTVKEFIWYGMFESFDWTQDANSPYLADYTLTFIAWKEQFRSDSPYYNSLPNNVQRGNSYVAYAAIAPPGAVTYAPPAQTTALSGQPQTNTVQPPGNTTATSPAQQATAVQPAANPTGIDSPTTTQAIFGADTNFSDFWQGIQ